MTASVEIWRGMKLPAASCGELDSRGFVFKDTINAENTKGAIERYTKDYSENQSSRPSTLESPVV